MVLCVPLLCWIGLYTVWGNQVNHPIGFSDFTTNHKIRWNQEFVHVRDWHHSWQILLPASIRT